MSSIQDIHALEERIFDIVDGYVKGDYNENDVHAIGRRCGKVAISKDYQEIITYAGSQIAYCSAALL